MASSVTILFHPIGPNQIVPILDQNGWPIGWLCTDKEGL